jgi:AcrR family transcriptional regulator
VLVSTATSAPARSRQATRRRLLDAATRLFAEGGLHRVTSHEIAREAGVAAGTFYLHFRDKADVHRQIVFQAVEELVVRVQNAVAAAGPAPALLLRARAEAIVDFAESHHALVRVLFGRDTESASIGEDALSRLTDGLEARLRLEQQEGRFPSDLDPAVCARAHVGMTAHLIDWWTQDPRRAPRERIVETLLRLQFSPTQTNDTTEE